MSRVDKTTLVRLIFKIAGVAAWSKQTKLVLGFLTSIYQALDID